MRSTAPPSPPRLGGARTVSPTGASATADAWRMPTCRRGGRRAGRSPCWSGATATRCSPPYMRPTRPHGCARSRRSRPCAGSGCSSSIWTGARCAGGRPTTSRPPRSPAARPTTPMPITPAKPPPRGSARILAASRGGGKGGGSAAAVTTSCRWSPVTAGREEPGPYRVASTTHHERRPVPSRGTARVRAGR